MFSFAKHPAQGRLDLAPGRDPARFGGPTAPQAGTVWTRREAAIMGTSILVQVQAVNARLGALACAAVMEEMHRIDRRMSPHKSASELSHINQVAGAAPVVCSEEMFRLLERAQAFARLTAGAFDITYAAVGRLYDYRAGRRPDAATLASARAAVGWRHLELDPHRRSVRFTREGMCIDLGGFAKGHAVDNAVATLKRLGITNAWVAAGGDSRALGQRDGRPWHVAIRHPRRGADAEPIAVLPLVDCAISTSGDYERYFDETQADGSPTRHHHLIDPATGESPRTLASVTVLADDGLSAEALSKAVFVLGAERGLALLDGLPGVDAVLVDAQGRLQYSAGLLHAGVASPQ